MERTKYMQQIMNETYAGVAVEAIMSGTISGAWETCIARRLKTDVEKEFSEAKLIVGSTNGDYLKAAHLITSSKIPETLNY